jgi:hypothetical protein
MQVIIQQLAEEHAREAALLWSLHDEEPDDDLRERIRLHVVGLRACIRRGADPLAGVDRPLRGADLLPAACLGPVEAEVDDEMGRRAMAAAKDFT